MSASATSRECEAKSPEGRVCGRVAGHAGAHIHYGSGASWMPVDAETWDREARAREWLRDYDGAETVENLAALLAEMKEQGRRAERAEIVTWLRAYADEAEGIPGPPQYEDALRNAADAVEDDANEKNRIRQRPAKAKAKAKAKEE